jgi:hypothetical protein
MLHVLCSHVIEPWVGYYAQFKCLRTEPSYCLDICICCSVTHGHNLSAATYIVTFTYIWYRGRCRIIFGYIFHSSDSVPQPAILFFRNILCFSSHSYPLRPCLCGDLFGRNHTVQSQDKSVAINISVDDRHGMYNCTLSCVILLKISNHFIYAYNPLPVKRLHYLTDISIGSNGFCVKHRDNNSTRIEQQLLYDKMEFHVWN